jgi:hypothetical protein
MTTPAGAAQSPAAAPSASEPGLVRRIGRRVLCLVRIPLQPLLYRFEHRVRTAVDKTAAAAAVVRLEEELLEQRAALAAIDRHLSALADALATVQRELGATRRAPGGGRDSAGPGAAD